MNKIQGLTMRSVTWNRFPIKNLHIDSLLVSHVESSYLKTAVITFLSLLIRWQRGKWQLRSNWLQQLYAITDCSLAGSRYWIENKTKLHLFSHKPSSAQLVDLYQNQAHWNFVDLFFSARLFYYKRTSNRTNGFDNSKPNHLQATDHACIAGAIARFFFS